MENHQTVVNALADCISVVEQNGIKIIKVEHPKASAAISLHGGHLLSFRPQGEKEVIWLSDKAEFSPEKAIRGGIPICWPWFGRIASPAHGFARTSQWHLVEHRENDQGVVVCLGLEETEKTLSIWPYVFQARLYIEISTTLKVTLDIHNTDDKPWHFSAALHSYFNLANIEQTITTGMGRVYSDSLQNGKVCQGEDELQLSDTVDRIYTQPESSIVINDAGNQRSIVIENQGDNAAVIWNPWKEGAATMGDMSDHGYQTMLCVESSYHSDNIAHGKTLQPGENHQLITKVSIK